jgi:hypothetical protein
MNASPINRRSMLAASGMGLGTLALASLLKPDAFAAEASETLAGRETHFAPRAKRVIHIFANGGPSQVDTFDPKPALKRLAGKVLDAKLADDRRLGGVAHPSPFKFAQHGESGLWISELFPELARCADDLCVVRSMTTDVPNHEPGLMMMNTGSIGQSRPSMGSWLLYGLGTENDSLPGFLVLCPNGLPTAASANWRSSFLPGMYQGTRIDTRETRPDRLVENIRNTTLSRDAQRQQLNYAQRLNELHRADRPDDDRLDARIQSLELAFRMQREALDAFDIELETAATRELYGDSLQGRQLLIARRLAERGVRYVQVYHGAGQPWDSHQNIEDAHRRLAQECDQPIAALLTDLKSRGLLEDTLVIWGGEIGRTPTVQLPLGPKPGRDHHHKGYTMWLAGGGVKGGLTYGSTNDVGLEVAENPVHVHDLHATILHLMGLDHTRLTYRHAGRDFRLTDIHGRVVNEILT